MVLMSFIFTGAFYDVFYHVYFVRNDIIKLLNQSIILSVMMTLRCYSEYLEVNWSKMCIPYRVGIPFSTFEMGIIYVMIYYAKLLAKKPF